MADLLGRLGNDQISLAEFWRRVAAAGLTDDDIDRFCEGTLR